MPIAEACAVTCSLGTLVAKVYKVCAKIVKSDFALILDDSGSQLSVTATVTTWIRELSDSMSIMQKFCFAMVIVLLITLVIVCSARAITHHCESSASFEENEDKRRPIYSYKKPSPSTTNSSFMESWVASQRRLAKYSLGAPLIC
ncbi:hypothetical protein MPTK1_6g20980 [Marchantia polymorpha subsp. ruderalis]|uniref:Transmembrane protein n=1 Tax=Marchantia polymorpha subsp. ruderalis TaxID=1480154 RepID=A0AAF6BUC6_MARPO|nr:hypothetical protein Mp_6g20980 [Marchantia polymorpha subsp. ruderalis]